MRIFIAINFPEIVKKQLAIIQKELDIEGCKLTKTNNLHLTLAFLGEVKKENIDNLSEIIEQFTDSIPPCEIGLHSLGCFPNTYNPQIVWVDVDSENLIHLGEKLKLLLSKKGFNPDKKPFSPHLTLGRIKFQTKETKTKITQAISRYKGQKFGIIKVGSIEIMESLLESNGPTYRVVEKCELKG